ncbi:MAG: TIGR02444 family protein [Pseudomonadota bacterium]
MPRNPPGQNSLGETADATPASLATEAGRLWTWSVAHYQKPGVSDLLISFQDAHNLNVNLILWCHWTATFRGAVETKILREAFAVSNQWAEQVVRPLRNVRRKLKTPSARLNAQRVEALRQMIKQSELDAEAIEQQALEQVAGPIDSHHPPPTDKILSCAKQNLEAYISLANPSNKPTPKALVDLVQKILL